MYRQGSDPSPSEIEYCRIIARYRLQTKCEKQITVKDALLHDEVQIPLMQFHETTFKGGVNAELICNWGQLHLCR